METQRIIDRINKLDEKWEEKFEEFKKTNSDKLWDIRRCLKSDEDKNYEHTRTLNELSVGINRDEEELL